MILSETVKQISEFHSVGDELSDKLKSLQKRGFKIISIFQTNVKDCNSKKTFVHFVIIYDDGKKNTMKKDYTNKKFIL